MKKESLKNLVGVVLFYLFIVLGIIIINARFEYLNSPDSGYRTINLAN